MAVHLHCHAQYCVWLLGVYLVVNTPSLGVGNLGCAQNSIPCPPHLVTTPTISYTHCITMQLRVSKHLHVKVYLCLQMPPLKL